MSSNLEKYVRSEAGGKKVLDLKVGGMTCASCASRIEAALTKEPGVEARVDVTTGHASVRWDGPEQEADRLAAQVTALGYTVSAYDVAAGPEENGGRVDFLRRCMIAAGVASVLVMGLGAMPVPPVWVMAAITVAVLVYAGRPFLSSALDALKAGHTNMDVPISLALVLTTGMSFFEILHQGTYAYFDSVVMLLFLLLIGRYLDEKTRGRAKAAATDLLSLFSGSATLVEGETTRILPIRELRPDMVLRVTAGEKIAADGIVTQGESEVDPSIITGETIAQPVGVGDQVFGGMINIAAPIHVRVTAASGESLVGEVIKLMEKARQAHGAFVRLADRVARLYTPAIFVLATATFVVWWLGGFAPWQKALLVTSTVLIITCPCAMGLAVPAVQVIASSRLFRRGMLLKTADALEKLTKVDTVVFDKTGTLTLGHPKLANRGEVSTEQLDLAAALASHSKHPLAKALVAAHGSGPVLSLDVNEFPGKGLEATMNGVTVRLGRRTWCGDAQAPADEMPEIWLQKGTDKPVRFAFIDAPRADAADVIATLKRQGYAIHLFSGDRDAVVQDVARRVGIESARGEMSPTDKNAAIEKLRADGASVLMVGDGLNDAAALAAADVSLSPSTALDITQNAADLVFQGEGLSPVLEGLTVAKRAEKLVRQNIALSLAYNVIAVPLSMAGLITPLLAAAAMSVSSLTVVFNAQRMRI